MDRTRFLRTVVTVAAVVLAVLPAAVVFGLGWLPIGHPDVPGGGSVPPDTTPLEAWVLFSLFYLGWMFALMVLLIWTYDRLGHHWRSWDRPPRKQKKRRVRLSAGMNFLAGQEKARGQAVADAARRRAAQEAKRTSAAGDGGAGQRTGSGARPSGSGRGDS
jgi:hypothetical protein